jgi:hypothetical protein
VHACDALSVNSQCSLLRARGLKSRKEKNEAVAGLFSQIGELYTVHHLWGEFSGWGRQGGMISGIMEVSGLMLVHNSLVEPS